MRPDDLLEAVRLHLADRLGAVDSRVAVLAGDVQQVAERQVSQFERLAADLTGLAGRVEKLVSQAPQGADLLAPVVEDLQHLRGQVAGLMQELEGTQEEVAQAGLGDLVARVQHLDGTLGNVRADTEKLVRRLEEVREELVAHQGDLGEEQASLNERLIKMIDGLAEGLEVRFGTAQAEVERFLAEHATLWDAALTALEARTTDRVLRLEEEVEKRLGGWERDLKLARDRLHETIMEEADRQSQNLSCLVDGVAQESDRVAARFEKCESDWQAMARVLDETLETRTLELDLRVEEATILRADAAKQALQNEFAEIIGDRLTDIEEKVEDGLYRIRGDLLHRYTQAEPWARGGEDYKALAIVRHRGGLWQAVERTSAEPGPDCSSWMLLVDGIHEVGYEIEEGRAWALTTLASGAIHRAPVPYPTFRSRGTYKAGESYRQWDTVVRNRTTFMAAQDTDTEPTNKGAHWIQLSDVVQGPKGPPGRDGRSVERDDLIALLPQITRMLADEMERRQEERELAAARAASEGARL